MRTPPITIAGSAHGTAKGHIQRAENRPDTVTIDHDVHSRPNQLDVGKTFTLVRPAVWQWKSQGEVFVPAGHGLVVLGVQDDRRLAIVFEEMK